MFTGYFSKINSPVSFPTGFVSFGSFVGLHSERLPSRQFFFAYKQNSISNSMKRTKKNLKTCPNDINKTYHHPNPKLPPQGVTCSPDK